MQFMEVRTMNATGVKEHARTGVAEMDREHALELQVVRALREALLAGDSDTALELTERLEDTTNAHFLAEQLLMRLHAYPGYEAHQQEHDRLIGELRELAGTFGAAGTVEPGEQVEMLERWLLAHMQSADQALAEYLRQPEPTVRQDV